MKLINLFNFFTFCTFLTLNTLYIFLCLDEKKSSFFPEELDDLYTTEDDSQGI